MLRESWCAMLEREMKFLVDQAEFERLMTAAQALYPDAEVKVLEQVNYYYDTEDLSFYTQGMTLRVREIDGSFAIERKTNKGYENGVREAEEVTTAVDALPEEIEGAKLGSDLSGFGAPHKCQA